MQQQNISYNDYLASQNKETDIHRMIYRGYYDLMEENNNLGRFDGPAIFTHFYEKDSWVCGSIPWQPAVFCAPYAVRQYQENGYYSLEEKRAGRIALDLARVTSATICQPIRSIRDIPYDKNPNCNPLLLALAEVLETEHIYLFLEIHTAPIEENILIDDLQGLSILGWPELTDLLQWALAPLSHVRKGSTATGSLLCEWVRKIFGIPALTLIFSTRLIETTLLEYCETEKQREFERKYGSCAYDEVRIPLFHALPNILAYCQRITYLREQQGYIPFEIERTKFFGTTPTALPLPNQKVVNADSIEQILEDIYRKFADEK